MHSLLTVAGILALITLAFGEDAARLVAAVILLGGLAGALWLAFLIIGERI